MTKPELAPYEILGVSSSASQAEVTAAYKVLAQIFHPDRYHGSPESVRLEAEARMKALNEAYAAARRGKLLWSPPVNGKRAANGDRPYPGGPGGPGGRTWAKVKWQDADRKRAAQAVAAEEARQARERQAANGQARVRPRSSLAYRGPIMNGMGLARFTGNLRCTGCDSVQWLPPDWRQRMEDSVFYCSFCDRAILCRDAKDQGRPAVEHR